MNACSALASRTHYITGAKNNSECHIGMSRAGLIWLRGVAVFLGILQFWTLRFTVMSDGISYLDIARNYAAGDWKMAVNAYWSPLLSWLMAPMFLIIGP